MLKKLPFFVVIAALLLTGCNQTSTNHTPSNTENREAVQNTTQEERRSQTLNIDFEKIYRDEEVREYAKSMIGQKAPNFTLTNLDGEKVRLSDFLGKNVILELAQTTCPYCNNVYPVIIDYLESVPEDIVVLQAYASEDKETVEAYLEANGYKKHFGILTGEMKNNVFQDYRTKWVPNFIFIDKDGFISFVYIGEVDREMLDDMATLAFKTL